VRGIASSDRKRDRDSAIFDHSQKLAEEMRIRLDRSEEYNTLQDKLRTARPTDNNPTNRGTDYEELKILTLSRKRAHR